MRLYRQVSPIPAGWPPPELDAGAAATLTYARQRDPIGDRVQAGLVALYVFTLAMPGTSVNDIAWASLAGCALVRLPATWRCATVLLRDRLLWLFAAWFAWRAVSVLWSADHAAGLDELGAARVMLTPLMMWPVLDRAPLYVGAFLVGVFGHNAVQAAQALNWFGLEPDPFYRLSGFLHPIHLATLCMAAMCWHLSALLHGSGARRGAILAWTTGLAAATAGLVFTGSRGPWIAAAVAVPLGFAVISLRRPATRRRAVVIAVLGVIAVTTSLPWTAPFIRFRIDQAVSEIRGGDGGAGLHGQPRPVDRGGDRAARGPGPDQSATPRRAAGGSCHGRVGRHDRRGVIAVDGPVHPFPGRPGRQQPPGSPAPR